MPTRYYSLREVLVLMGLAFIAGGIVAGLWLYWPLISESLWHPQ